MKTFLVLLACSLAAVAVLPTAEAQAGPDVQCMDVYRQTHLAGPYWLVQRDTCSAQIYECPDGHSPPAAPCRELSLLEASSASAAAPSLDFPLCQPVAVGRACFSPYWPGCNVWIEWTAIPLQNSCLYRSDPLAMSAAGPDVQCMDVYRETHLAGPYWLVQRDSCSAQVYECPEGYSPPGPPCQPAQVLSTDATAACYMVYTRHDVGTFSVVRTSSCAVPMAYQCPYEGAPISQCDNVLTLAASSAAVAAPGVGLPPVYCMPYEREVAITNDLSVVQGGCGSYVRLCGDRLYATNLGDADPACLLDDLVAASLPGAPSPPVNCFPYTNEYDAGPVTVVQGGCGNDVRLCDDSVLRTVDVSCIVSIAAPPRPVLPPVQCSDIYARHEVGPAAVVMTSGCSGHAELCDDEVTLRHIDTSCVLAPLSTSQPLPDPTERRCWRQQQGELGSEYCVDPSDPDCLVFYRQITGVGSRWQCYPSGEGGSDW